MSIWRFYQKRLDLTVDGKFAEPVRLVPWKAGSYSSSGTQDPSRTVLDTIGIYVRPGAVVVGEGGTQGAGLSTRMLTQDVWLSIMDDYVVNPASWVKGDRVFFPERNEWYEIAYQDLSATGRPSYHLIRLQASSLLMGMSGVSHGNYIMWDDGQNSFYYDPVLEEVVSL